MDKWFYRHRSRELGPLSADELRYLASITKIVADTMIRKEGSVDWVEYCRSEIFTKPISTMAQVTASASVPEKRLNVDQPRESVSREVATLPNPDHAPPGPAIAPLTEEEQRARVFSVAVVLSLLVMLTLLVLLWPSFTGLSGGAGNQNMQSADEAGSGAVKGDSEIPSNNVPGDLAVSADDSDDSPSAAADSADEMETPAAPSSTTTATTESPEEMAEAEPPDVSTSDKVTAGSIVETEPENRELDEKFGISLPKKKSRTESGTSRVTPGGSSFADVDERLREAGAKTGDVQISLAWNNGNDLDLHVETPGGERIWFQQRRSTCQGELDVDMNAEGPTSQRPVENVYWPPGKSPSGKFRVLVHHYANHTRRDPTVFQVTINAKGRIERYRGSLQFGEPLKLVSEFNVE